MKSTKKSIYALAFIASALALIAGGCDSTGTQLITVELADKDNFDGVKVTEASKNNFVISFSAKKGVTTVLDYSTDALKKSVPESAILNVKTKVAAVSVAAKATEVIADHKYSLASAGTVMLPVKDTADAGKASAWPLINKGLLIQGMPDADQAAEKKKKKKKKN